MNSSIELLPIELKGRGKRYNEIFYKTLDEAVEDIFKQIKGEIIDDDYAIYGHSMGSILGYELYYKIYENNLRKPNHIFFSGHEAPKVKKSKGNLHCLPDLDFMNKVIDLGGTPQELIEDKEVMEIFLPIIRNDFKILETYVYKEKREKIKCDVTILNGKQDSIKLEGILAWKSHADKGFKIYNFEGNHFFINDNVEKIAEIINCTLIN